MKFTKMQGAGNDYVYFNCLDEMIENPAELSIRLSERHFGIGSDGIILIVPSDKADFGMRMFNADGSESGMCGNGVRCIAKYVYEKKLTDKKAITLETKSGIKHLYVDDEGGKVKSISVDMGKASFKTEEVPALCDAESIVGYRYPVAGREDEITCLTVGNPHCVIFCDDPEVIELERVGPAYENAPIFPERTNTEFVSVISPTELHMRVWERGSGETLACGTGTCAAVAAAVVRGYSPYGCFVKVKLRGGELEVKYERDGSVTLRGGAEFVYEGEIDI